MRIFAFAVAILLSFSVTTVHAAFKLEGEPKIAFMYLGPANDGGWTESHDIARQRLENALDMKIVFSENIPEDSSKVRQAIDLYVKRGFNIIVGTSFGYGDAFLEASKDYPNVAFLNAAGITNSGNLESFYARTYQGWYLAGMIAAANSENGKLGMLAGFPLGLVNWDINAFMRGAQAVNPDIELAAVFANTWYDPVKEGQIAEALLDGGADVIATDLSAASALNAAEKRSKSTVGFQIDMSGHAPNGHLASVIFNWDAHLLPTIQKIMDGSWEPSEWGAFVGVEIDAVALAGVTQDLPDDLKAKIDTALQQMRDGTLTPFDGPVRNQKGELVVEAGSTLDDEGLWNMDYFVQGIVGTMPESDK
jgi:basic membrane lipoprotein Med (substrate-binding protein (PBP1-ABC) superfamily)